MYEQKSIFNSSNFVFPFRYSFHPRAARCARVCACISRVWSRSIVSARTRIFPPSESPCPSGNPTSFAPLLSGRCVQMRFSIDQPARSFRTSASRKRNISPWQKDALRKERQDLRPTSQENTYTSVTETARLEFHFHCRRDGPTHRALTLRSRHYCLFSRGQLKSILRRACFKKMAVPQILENKLPFKPMSGKMVEDKRKRGV